MSDKVLLDTSILIEVTKRGNFISSIETFLNPKIKIYTSAVSLNEYLRGCHDKESLDIAMGLISLFGGKTIVPTYSNWIECAHISELLLKIKKRNKQDILLLQNDILIALGSRDTQATLITADKTDFSLIQNYLKFDVEYWN
ncbi:MAG: type II toxin-antitoxin system VapC family toxin [Deltaproteobacteria bacterium]|nr:type II toxin-antitoxin system VapC family toxin [Deltaproteobacteria bacterium]